MKLPDSDKIINLATLIGLLIVIFIIYKIMASLGIIKTRASKNKDKNEAAAINVIRTGEFWNPEYYKGKVFKSLGNNTAEQYARDLRDAMRGVGTDEEAIFSTFGKMYNKFNISEVSDKYKQQYGFPFYIMSDNLQADLLDELSDAEAATLIKIINELPNN
jgi:hypothetical protein